LKKLLTDAPRPRISQTRAKQTLSQESIESAHANTASIEVFAGKSS
jgi:hypothetical protein